MRGHWSLLLMIGQFRPVEGRGSVKFLFADNPLATDRVTSDDRR
jgi:hypothetical protein